MIKVVGLDPSLTAFGLAASDGPGRIMLHRITPRLRGHERLALLLLQVHDWCEGADLAVIEGVAFGAPGNALLDLAGLNLLVRHMLWEMNIPYTQIPPVNLKQWATGSHQADKVAMSVAAVRRFPRLKIDSHDVADALWLCAAGCEHTGQPLVKMPKDQVAVLHAVHAEKRRRGQPKIAWPVLETVPDPLVPAAGLF